MAIKFSKQISWKESDLITDDEGRMVIVKGQLGEQKVTLANLYLPNVNPISALERYLEIIQQNKEGTLILGGDLNIALEPTLDVSKGRSHISNIKLRKVKSMLQDAELVDSWRIMHVHDKDYSFFSAKHKTYTRIDYIFIDQNILFRLRDASIGSITISDHAPTSCSIEWGERGPDGWNWKINETLLKDPIYEKQLAREIDTFFDINDLEETSPMYIWEAHKCYLRGVLISLGTHRKRSLGAKLNTLLGEIRTMEMAHKKSTDTAVRGKADGPARKTESYVNRKSKS